MTQPEIQLFSTAGGHVGGEGATVTPGEAEGRGKGVQEWKGEGPSRSPQPLVSLPLATLGRQ